MGFLAIQFPKQDLVFFQGEWKETDLKSLPEEAYFITDFTKEKIYYFTINEKIDSFPEQGLAFFEEDSVFEVNGKYYLNGLQYFLDGFEENGIEKAIYSRIKLEKKGDKSLKQIFRDLTSIYKDKALVYCVSDEEFGTWMGATPEILIKGNEESMETMALAGTKKDEAIEWTSKEIEEHQFVITHVQESIEKCLPIELEISSTKTIQAGEVFHLQTDFNFLVSKENWKNLLDELHPTPAVGGTPKIEAQEYILKYEPHERKFYTGLIGWLGKKDLNVFVNLRCMQVLQDSYALYVGGGITKDSNISDEWAETEAKSKTLLKVIF